MRATLAALLSGVVFGAGLALSGMTSPARVLGFLDVSGDWDPTLLFVMGGALAVATPGFAGVLRWSHPLIAEGFRLPARTDLDAPLIVGAAVFGIGWGLAGLCPGPAIAGLVTGSPGVMAFVTAMCAGQWLAWLWERRRG